MAYYFARVELRGNPSSTDYMNLHAVMQQQGFLRTININGGKYELPSAEYVWDTLNAVTAPTLVALLNPIISAVNKNFLLLVSRADDVAGFLMPAE